MELKPGKKIELVNLNDAKYVTHGGVFHADETLATAMISYLEDSDAAKVARTFKVPEGLSEDVLVYDIGLGRYDHHQSEEIKARRENGMAYCGAGLIWRDFGRDVLSRMGIEEEIVDRVWKSVDARLVLGVDGRDNGVDVGGTYEGMDVSSIVRAMNPGWDEDAGSDERFLEAVRFMDGALRLAVKSAASAARARRFVEEAIGSSDGVVLELDRYVPWQGALAASENPKAAGILRNVEMHDLAAKYPKRGCVAFWDGKSRGTAHSFGLADERGTQLRVVRVGGMEWLGKD